MTTRFWLTAALVAAGCSGNTPRPTSAALADGLTVLEAKDPMFGVNAAFKEQSRVVYVETRVGSLKPEIYRNDSPGAPAYEMDMRFVDQNNHTFFAMRGGDSFVDPTWTREMGTTAHTQVTDLAGRELDFALAQKAAAALGTALPAAFKDHAFHAIAYSKQPLPSQDAHLIAASAQVAKAPPPAAATSEQAYGSFNSGGWSQFWTGKYSGDTGCVFWTCAKHSATDMWSCDWNGSGCSWVRRIVANNHGRSPWDGGMGYDCASQGGWQYNGIDGSTAGGADGNWDGQGGCQTGYSWSSNNYAHLCNDDAAYELWEAKSGPQDAINFYSTSPGGWGSGYRGFGNFSCSYPSGDWNTPNCP
jgi:hypothetical protein